MMVGFWILGEKQTPCSLWALWSLQSLFAANKSWTRAVVCVPCKMEVEADNQGAVWVALQANPPSRPRIAFFSAGVVSSSGCCFRSWVRFISLSPKAKRSWDKMISFEGSWWSSQPQNVTFSFMALFHDPNGKTLFSFWITSSNSFPCPPQTTSSTWTPKIPTSLLFSKSLQTQLSKLLCFQPKPSSSLANFSSHLRGAFKRPYTAFRIRKTSLGFIPNSSLTSLGGSP